MRSGFPIMFAAALGGCAADASQPLASVEYRSDGQLIMVEARIDDAPPAWFMVDSGASHSVIDPRHAARIGLEAGETGSVTGAGSGQVPIRHARAATMSVGGFVWDIPDPWLIDLSGVPISRDAVGLVGAEIFKSHVVRIDPVRRRFEIFDPGDFRPDRGARSIPLIVDGDRLFIEVGLDVRPGLSVTHRVRVDTGAQMSVNDEIVGQAIERRRSLQGGGLGDDFEAWSGRYEAVRLGDFTIRDVWGPGSPGPAIGMELLRRFVLTFDAPHGRLWLVPTDALDDPVPPPG